MARRERDVSAGFLVDVRANLSLSLLNVGFDLRTSLLKVLFEVFQVCVTIGHDDECEQGRDKDNGDFWHEGAGED